MRFTFLNFGYFFVPFFNRQYYLLTVEKNLKRIDFFVSLRVSNTDTKVDKKTANITSTKSKYRMAEKKSQNSTVSVISGF